jgi:glycosyltransferase involved in cell wall biosynthesis
MKIIITSPSLNINQNVSGISSVTQFIIRYNSTNEYLHFELGRKDNEIRNLKWFFRTLRVYLKWFYLMVTLKDILVHFNLALTKASIIRDFPLIFMARHLGKRMIIHIHGGDLFTPKTKYRNTNLFLSLIFSGKNPVIVLGHHEKKVIQEKFNYKNIFVLPNCIGLKEASEFERLYTNNDILNLLFLGRITEDKGIEYIFLALKSLKKRGIKFKFIMAGKGPGEKIFIPKFNDLLGSDFEFKGVVAGIHKIELLKKCNVFLLPSFYEGLPMALLESMSFSLVPIITNVGSIKYVISDGVNGIFVKSHSSEEIVYAIEKLSKDKVYMQKLGNNSRQFIFDKFNPNEYIAKLNEIYDYE